MGKIHDDVPRILLACFAPGPDGLLSMVTLRVGSGVGDNDVDGETVLFLTWIEVKLGGNENGCKGTVIGLEDG